MNFLLKLSGWSFIVIVSLFFLILTVLPILDTNDAVVFEMGTFCIALGRYAGLIAIFGILPIWIASRRIKHAKRA